MYHICTYVFIHVYMRMYLAKEADRHERSHESRRWCSSCIHIYVHIYIYIYKYMYIHIYIHIYTYIYIKYIHVHMYLYIYICVCTWRKKQTGVKGVTDLSVGARLIYIYIYTFIYIYIKYIHVHMYIYIYIYMCMYLAKEADRHERSHGSRRLCSSIPDMSLCHEPVPMTHSCVSMSPICSNRVILSHFTCMTVRHRHRLRLGHRHRDRHRHRN